MSNRIVNLDDEISSFKNWIIIFSICNLYNFYIPSIFVKNLNDLKLNNV